MENRSLNVLSSQQLPAGIVAEHPPLAVLVVDDELAFLEEMVDRIDRAGIPVQGCPGPEEALSIIETKRPSLIFLDVLLPRIDGLRVAELARAANGDVRIILMTGSEDVYYDTLMPDQLASGVMKKPFSFQLLMPYLEAFVKRA